MLIKRIYLQKEAPIYKDAVWAKPNGDKIELYMWYIDKWVPAGMAQSEDEETTPAIDTPPGDDLLS